MRVIIALAVVLAFSGCASVPMGTEADNQAALKFVPQSGKANVYILRRPAYVAVAILATTALDTQMSGGLKAGSFILKTVVPGTHTVTVFSNENQASLTFQAEPGQNYFFDVKSEMGMVSARFSIHQMSSAEGEAGTKLCKITRAL
jgi:uncharacterized protein YceK